MKAWASPARRAPENRSRSCGRQKGRNGAHGGNSTAAGKDPITLHVSAAPLPSDTGRREVIVMLNDLGGAERIEQNLARLDRLASIGTLSASMGHEIKNALVAVKIFVDLLLEKNCNAQLAEVVSREMPGELGF